MIAGDLKRALPERTRTMKVRDDGFDLRVVEDHAVRLVSDETIAPQGVFPEEDIRGDVNQLWHLAEATPDGQKYLIPGDAFVTRDVKSLADGFGIAQKSHEPDSEILVMGERPEGSPVPMHDDWLVFSHAVEDGAAILEGQECFVVGVGRTDDGRLQEPLSIGVRESLLAGDLVPTVLPIGIVERRRLSDR